MQALAAPPMFPTSPFPLAGLLPALASVPNYHSNPITQRVRRKRQRLPPSLLIENASDVFLAFQNIACPRRFRSRLATIRKLSRSGPKCRVRTSTETYGVPQKGSSRYRHQDRRSSARPTFSRISLSCTRSSERCSWRRSRARTTDYRWCGTFLALALAGGAACRCGAVSVVPWTLVEGAVAANVGRL